MSNVRSIFVAQLCKRAEQLHVRAHDAIRNEGPASPLEAELACLVEQLADLVYELAKLAEAPR